MAHHAGCLSQAITAVLATGALAGMQIDSKDEVTAAPSRLQNALRFVLAQNPVVAKTVPDATAKRHSNKSPSNSGAIAHGACAIKSVGLATTHDSQSSSNDNVNRGQEIASTMATVGLCHGVTQPAEVTFPQQPQRQEVQLGIVESKFTSNPYYNHRSKLLAVFLW